MSGTKKKEKAPTKARQTAAKKGNVPATNGNPVNGTTVPHEEVAKLAHRFWAERGHQAGRPEDDWFRAERELLGKAS
jgi:hypothetical protein